MSDTDRCMAVSSCNCGSNVVVRLPSNWQTLVNEVGLAIPIIGCGNPWHYADLDDCGHGQLSDDPRYPAFAATATLAATPAPLDVDRLARALLRAVPGYGRWMAYQRGTPAMHDLEARADAALSEARAHAAAIAAAYAEETP
jgi:hypothetical protein